MKIETKYGQTEEVALKRLSTLFHNNFAINYEFVHDEWVVFGRIDFGTGES